MAAPPASPRPIASGPSTARTLGSGSSAWSAAATCCSSRWPRTGRAFGSTSNLTTTWLPGVSPHRRWRPDLRWGFDSACNWKFPIENTLESYHIPCLHPRSFGGVYPSEQAQEHTLDDRYTTLTLRLGRGPQAPLLARDDHPSARRRIDEHLHPLPYPSQPRLRAHGPLLLRGLVPAHVSGLDTPAAAELSLPRPAAWAGPGAALAVRGSHRPVDDAPGDVGRYRHIRRPAEGDGGQPTPWLHRDARGADLHLPAIHPEGVC